VNREALLVLGMHRSGTSAVAGLLIRLGAQGPKTLMQADAGNPEGYWESAAFYEFHERLLRTAGSRWDAYTRLDPDWFQSRIPADLHDECRRLLQAEFGDAPRFVLKDPRMCRFVPFWLRTLKNEAITPVAVLVYRNPLEVARSLEARGSFERERSLLIWLRHVLDAEFDTRSTRRTFVRYHDVLGNWKLVAQGIARDLGETWPARSSADEVEIERFLNPGLRHQRADGDAMDVAPVLADWVRRAWAALEGLHQRDPNQVTKAMDTLDVVRQEFDRATAVFGRLAEQRTDDVQAERDGLRARFDHLEREHRGLLSRTAGLEALRNDLERQVQTLEQHADSLQRELSAAQYGANALRESLSWRVTAPLRAALRIFR